MPRGTWWEPMAKISLPMLVLAGGFGTRLRSVVSDAPKPLAPAGNAPFLQHLLALWHSQGVRRFIFLLHHQAEVMERFIEERAGDLLLSCEIRTVVESVPMGTGGAIANAVRTIGLTEPFLVANADTWVGDGLGALAASPAPTIAVVKVPDAGRYGGVELVGSKVCAFAEKQRSAGAGWINAGLYHLEPAPFRDWDGAPFSLEETLLPQWARHDRLGAVKVNADFIDIGVPDDYFRFCRWIETGKGGTL